jgi:Asp-tRNA(Asn)/Glu-tRNA(Gln) amidotransferase C subunit
MEKYLAKYFVEGTRFESLEEAEQVARQLANEQNRPIEVYRLEKVKEIYPTPKEIHEISMVEKVEKEKALELSAADIKSLRSQIESIVMARVFDEIYKACEESIAVAWKKLESEKLREWEKGEG